MNAENEAQKRKNVLKARELYLKREENKEATRLQNQKEYTQRSPQEQLKVLDKRLGKDQGAVKERKSLKQKVQAGRKNATKRTKK